MILDWPLFCYAWSTKLPKDAWPLVALRRLSGSINQLPHLTLSRLHGLGELSLPSREPVLL
jgi:hypothetical protein